MEYKALLEIDPENALKSAHLVMMNLCEIGGAVAGKLMNLPGMKSAFMWLLPKMAVFSNTRYASLASSGLNQRVIRGMVSILP